MQLVHDVERDVSVNEIGQAPMPFDLFERRLTSFVREDAPHKPVQPRGNRETYGVVAVGVTGSADAGELGKKSPKLHFRQAISQRVM